MPKVTVSRFSKEELLRRGVERWPVWEKKVSRFDWHYDSSEECYFLQGKAVIETGGERIAVGSGDFVFFPAGLSCVWNIEENIKKHYRFI